MITCWERSCQVMLMVSNFSHSWHRSPITLTQNFFFRSCNQIFFTWLGFNFYASFLSWTLKWADISIFSKNNCSVPVESSLGTSQEPSRAGMLILKGESCFADWKEAKHHPRESIPAQEGFWRDLNDFTGTDKFSCWFFSQLKCPKIDSSVRLHLRQAQSVARGDIASFSAWPCRSEQCYQLRRR